MNYLVRTFLGMLLLGAVAIFDLNCPGDSQLIPGFWTGLWHGFIAWVDLVLMALGKPGVTIYAQINNGAWYGWGFLFGVGIYTGILGGINGKNE